MSGERCQTCGDLAEQMRVIEVDAGRRLAVCERKGGERVEVEIELVETPAAGELLLVHAGTAIA